MVNNVSTIEIIKYTAQSTIQILYEKLRKRALRSDRIATISRYSRNTQIDRQIQKNDRISYASHADAEHEAQQRIRKVRAVAILKVCE